MQRRYKLVDDTGAERTALQEQNRKAFQKQHTDNFKRVMSQVKESAKLEKPEDVCNFSKDDFSVKKFREAAYALTSRLKEAQSEGMFGQLLRAGVLNEFNNIYQAVEVTYDAAVKQTSSNKRQEFYAPLERVGFPKRVERGESFPETNFKGLDLELINVKYGNLLDIERELIDDDQTGQIVQRAQQMGENARIHEEALVWGRISDVSGLTFDGEPIVKSLTYSGGAYKTAADGGLHGSGWGVNATSDGRISQTQIQNGWILSKKMLDSSGRPMVVKPTLLAVSPQDIFFATVLMDSEYNPSKASTATGDDGKVSGNMSINPIKNLAGVLSTRFLPDYSALLIDAGKGYAFQRRDPTEIVQENPQSGPAFSQEIFRYKVRTRWESDFIDPKFIININRGLSST